MLEPSSNREDLVGTDAQTTSTETAEQSESASGNSKNRNVGMGLAAVWKGETEKGSVSGNSSSLALEEKNEPDPPCGVIGRKRLTGEQEVKGLNKKTPLGAMGLPAADLLEVFQRPAIFRDVTMQPGGRTLA